MKKNKAYTTTVEIMKEWTSVVAEWADRISYAEETYYYCPSAKNAVALYQEEQRFKAFKQRVLYTLARDNENLESPVIAEDPVKEPSAEMIDKMESLSEQYNGMTKRELAKVLLQRICKEEIIELLLSMDAYNLTDKG